ncbi:MAG TPA: hypothetical protein VMZ91_15900 [Candidatus Paceibacterota bacterium]|nr:hypothetical protein [Candidatus Paceibacterota bacterium]
MENINLIEEHLEGTLCEKGFMKERFDMEKNDLVRNLTEKGRERCLELLKDPEYKREYLKMAQIMFKDAPLSVRKIAWKKIANQISS